MKSRGTRKRRIIGYIFRAWITRNGIKDRAKDRGFKAWRIPIYAD